MGSDRSPSRRRTRALGTRRGELTLAQSSVTCQAPRQALDTSSHGPSQPPEKGSTITYPLHLFAFQKGKRQGLSPGSCPQARVLLQWTGSWCPCRPGAPRPWSSVKYSGRCCSSSSHERMQRPHHPTLCYVEPSKFHLREAVWLYIYTHIHFNISNLKNTESLAELRVCEHRRNSRPSRSRQTPERPLCPPYPIGASASAAGAALFKKRFRTLWLNYYLSIKNRSLAN